MLVADLMVLFYRLEEDKAFDRFRSIKEAGVEVIDLIIGKPVSKISDGAFKALYMTGRRHKQINSVIVKYSARRRKSKTPASISFKASKVASAEAAHFHTKIRPHLVEAIQQVNLSGKVTLEKIADEINRKGVRTLHGREWSKGTVRNTLSKLNIDWKA